MKSAPEPKKANSTELGKVYKERKELDYTAVPNFQDCSKQFVLEATQFFFEPIFAKGAPIKSP